MPNFHGDHIKKTDQKCELNSQIIEICLHNFLISLFMAFCMGTIFIAMIVIYTKKD